MNKTILITGASTGIGRASALHFQQAGWNVIASMRTPAQESQLTALENVLVTRLDVTDAASIESAVSAGLARFGRIDALLNNAGYGAYGPLEATPMDKVRRQFEVNVMGLLATTQAVLPYMRRQKSGVILNVSSIGGRITFPLGTLYHGTKFAVEGLSESLHFELLPLGVRVKLIEPGMVRTDFAGRSFDFSNDPAAALGSSEWALECFYDIVVTPSVHIKPDLQWFVDPADGGDDALVGTLRVTIAF